MTDAPRPLRILLATLRYPPHVVGGYEQLAHEVAVGLRARGHRVDVLCGHSASLAGLDGCLPWLHPPIDTDDDLFEVGYRSDNVERLKLHFHRPFNRRATARAIAAVEPDVFLYFNLGLASIAPLFAARRAAVPRVGVVCDLWPGNHWVRDWRERGGKRVRRAVLELAWRRWSRFVGWGRILTPSEAMRRALVAEGVDPSVIERLPTGITPAVEERAFAQPLRARRPGDALVVACTSMHWEGKGIHVLLEAAALAVERGVDLRVRLAGSGEGDYAERLRRLAARPSLAGRVEFLGLLPQTQLDGLLRTSHVFAFPSLWHEPFARAPMEAMAFGLALVAADAGGTPEQFEDGESGLLVPADDAPALADALVRLDADEPLRERLAADARVHARTHFRFDRFLGGLEAVLAESADGRAGVAGGRTREARA